MEIRNEFILAAHKAACNTWKAKIEEQCPELFPTMNKKVQDLSTYERFLNVSNGAKSISITPERIRIQLPTSNSKWSFAAWDLAKDICQTLDFAPVHNIYMVDSDYCFGKEGEEIIVLVKK